MKENKLSGRTWFNLILFGFMGQIAWNVENIYFNTFLYNSVYNGASQEAVNGSIDVVTAINLMVALSAVTAVLATLLMGTLSDKLNRRKIFISVGYILWGLVTACFGFISRDNVASLLGLSDGVKILTATVWAVIIMDCIMTFVGSTSNDSAFNSWVTDVTNIHNRGTAESVLALLPIIALLAVTVLGMLVVNIGYDKFFIILGGFVSICGIVGLFTLQESRSGVKQQDTRYLQELVYGFRPSVIKSNQKLYLSFASICIFSVAVNVFFPYLIIYLERSLGLDLNNLNITPAAAAVAVVAVAAVVGGIIGMGKLVDRYGKEPFLIVSVILFVTGLTAASFAKTLGLFGLLAVPALIGYGMLMIMLNAAVRDFTPEDKVGQFQGVRMIFFVLIPMVVGPTLGNIATKTSSIFYTNDYGVQTPVPTSLMFVVAAAVGIFILIPVLILRKKGLKQVES